MLDRLGTRYDARTKRFIFCLIVGIIIVISVVLYIVLGIFKLPLDHPEHIPCFEKGLRG